MLDLKPEDALIPYTPSPLPPAPWLVLAPHPDDEALGLGGTLVRAAEKGLPVTVVFVSDGEKGGDPEQRRREAAQALKRLGLKVAHFWRLPDREVHKCFDAFAQKFRKFLTPKIKTIFAPSFWEFHPDHRAVTWFSLALLEALGWPGEVWLYEISRQGEVNRLVDISSVIERKKAAVSAYRSQLAQHPYLDISLALNRARAYTLAPLGVTYAEGFWAGTVEEIVSCWAERLKAYLP